MPEFAFVMSPGLFEEALGLPWRVIPPGHPDASYIMVTAVREHLGQERSSSVLCLRWVVNLLWVSVSSSVQEKRFLVGGDGAY